MLVFEVGVTLVIEHRKWKFPVCFGSKAVKSKQTNKQNHTVGLVSHFHFESL